MSIPAVSLAAVMLVLLFVYGTTAPGYTCGLPVPDGTRIQLGPGLPPFEVDFQLVENNSRLIGSWGSDYGIAPFVTIWGEPPIIPPPGAWRFYCTGTFDDPPRPGHYNLTFLPESENTTHIIILDTIAIAPPRAVNPTESLFRGTTCPSI